MSTRQLELGQRSETVRRANLSAIVRELHIQGPCSRSRLGARTGLTRSAIRTLIGELVALELVHEEQVPSGGAPGRPSPTVHPDLHGAVVLALEIAVDSVAVALVGLGGGVLNQMRVDRPHERSSVDDTIADLVELVGIVGGRVAGPNVLVGIGASVTGIVRRSDGFVAMAPNLGWRDVHLGERLESALDLGLPVSVANDADLGAMAEHRRGAAVGSDHLLFLSGEVGVGGSVIIDGEPLRGFAGYAGEVGHLPINPDGATCRCGSVGCWETEIGEGTLLLRAGHPADGGRVAVNAVLLEAAQGSPLALAALDDLGRWLGLGLAGLVNVFNPGLIVLGGLFATVYPFVASTVRAAVDRQALAPSRALVEIVPARLGVDAPLLGAAELAFEPLLADPATIAQRRHRPQE